MASDKFLSVFLLIASLAAAADESGFAGVVASATPEATAAGIGILEQGGNAIDAAVAVSLTLTVSEPAGSGIAGQTVILVKKPGEPAFVIHGTTWSPRSIPEHVTKEQLRRGRTAATVPSTLRVLDLAHRRFGSGTTSWASLLQPAIEYAEQGFEIGPFRARAFRNYRKSLLDDDVAAGIFIKADATSYQVGERLKQPLLANTLRRIANHGAMDFYNGAIAKEIIADVAANDGWITLDDLRDFPEPKIVPAIQSSYRGFDIETLPPPFGGWVVLQILNVLEQSDKATLAHDDSERRLVLLDALRIGHTSRRSDPVTNYTDYADTIKTRNSKQEAQRLLAELHSTAGGETTHFSIVDADGMAVAVTQSIDSYFGAKVAHPTLGFLYNNYMQGFQVEDPDAPYYLRESQMPLSSMSATIVSQNDRPQLVVGSPGSARIISSVAQVTSHWIDIGAGVAAAVDAYRVHVVPEDQAYVEGPELLPELLAGMARRRLHLRRPAYGVSDGHLDPYFGGVHALALENGHWRGAADPRRDGRAAIVGQRVLQFDNWAGPAMEVHVYVPPKTTPDTPIVFVIHGWSRDIDRYFADWSALGAEHGFIVVVPYFSTTLFPGSNEFNLGHVFDERTAELRPEDEWAFSVIEPLFDHIVAWLGSGQRAYTLFGHSAGSQFVHRYLYYKPAARVKRYLAANAGWYTLPDFDETYPYGLREAAISESSLRRALGKDLVLLLGREDTDRDDPNLRKTAHAERQGPNRFVRGHTMYDIAKNSAQNLGVDLRWQVVIVNDAGHVNAEIARAAATLIE